MAGESRWRDKRAELSAEPRRFFRFWGIGTGVIVGAFLLYWMWNDPPADPKDAARAFLIVLAIAIAVPPVVWFARSSPGEGN
jgi:hypothetical protein